MNSPDSSPAEGWPRNQPLEHAAAKIFTIGHSVIPPQRFIEILKTAGIETLVDVRSTPYSRRVPHANRENLQPTITREGIEYLYLGDYLGGMPRIPRCLARTVVRTTKKSPPPRPSATPLSTSSHARKRASV